MNTDRHTAPAMVLSGTDYIALCDRFAVLAVTRRNLADITDDEDEMNNLLCPIEDIMGLIAPQIWSARASTLDEVRAKAKAAVAYYPPLMEPTKGDWAQEFVDSIMRDLTGEPVT